MVIGELPLLRNTRRLGRLPISLGIVQGLNSVIVVLFAGYAAFVETALPLQFQLVVFENRFLLSFGAALLINRRLLL